MVSPAIVRNDFALLRSDVQRGLVARQPDHIARVAWSRVQIEAAQRDGLRSLLGHAMHESPFHRRRLGRLDPAHFDLQDLARLPVMTKAEMMDNLDDVFTDRGLTRDAIEDALARTTSEPVPILGRYVALVTGGVSGRRGVYVFDSSALVEFFSCLTRSLFARLHQQGGVPSNGVEVAFVSAASAVHATGTAAAMTGGVFPWRAVAVPVTLAVDDIVRRLNQLQLPLLYGYASMLAGLAAEQDAGRLHITPRAVTNTSETLAPEQRDAIRKAFGVPIVDAFGSTEGLVGSTAPDDDVFTFNSDSCIAELVDDDDRPVPLGTPSAKVLVTNLYNHVQPLIRYELADVFVRQPDAETSGHLRATVQGRADEVLHYGGIDVHPHVVRSVLLQQPELLDYRVRQTQIGLHVDLVTASEVDRDGVARDLGDALASAGLVGPVVTVRVVEDLERLPDTGKLQRFVPLATDIERGQHA